MAPTPAPDHSWEAVTGAVVSRVLIVTGLVMALSVPTPSSASVVRVDRVAGPERIATAVAASIHGFDRATSVVVARADDFPDALAAGPLARALGAPLLLTAADRVDDAVMAEIARLGATSATIVGGTGVVGDQVSRQLSDAGVDVERRAGPSRFDTAAAIAMAVGAPSGEAVLTLGEDTGPVSGWADALSSAAFGLVDSAIPLLLTRQDALPTATAQALVDLDVTRVTVIGGTAAVSDAVLAELRAGGRTVTRLAGPTRFATSAAVLDHVTARPDFAQSAGFGLVAATGADFPDGLTAGGLTGALEAAAVLVPTTDLDGAAPAVVAAIRRLAPRITAAVVLGGTDAVDDVVQARLAELVSESDAEVEPGGEPGVGEDPPADVDGGGGAVDDEGPDAQQPGAGGPATGGSGAGGTGGDVPDGSDDGADTGGDGGDSGDAGDDDAGDDDAGDDDAGDGDGVFSPAGFTSMASAARAVHVGVGAPQQGVADGTIEDRRVALLRGAVTDVDGTPLAGVRTTVLDHPELGSTTTAADGTYTMAVNGGGPLTVQLDGDGFLPVQRTVQVEWREWTVVDTVTLTRLDTVATEVTLADGGVHRSSTSSDDAGDRQATLIFPAGITADLTFDDGRDAQPVDALTVRVTEYTVGDTTLTGNTAEAAMPGELPPASGFTYAAELSADEAIAAGADGVDFSGPVPLYVDNFLDFDVGEVVPFGFYDRTDAAWEPEPDGRVVRVHAIDGDGRAVLDLDGDADGDADDDAIAAVLGVTPEELAQLGALYGVDAELWRMRVTHFSAYDCNWGFGPPDDADTPDQDSPPGGRRSPYPPCRVGGSIIGCQDQVLGERLPLTGTDRSLTYSSVGQPGRTAESSFTIDLGTDLHPDLLAILLQVDIGGRRTQQVFEPIDGQTFEVEWDGVDALGRQTVGYQPVDYSISYVYPGFYRSGARVPGVDQDTFSFNLIGRDRLQGNRARAQIALTAAFEHSVRSPDTATDPAGLGGWTLDVVHSYDPVAGIVSGGGDPSVDGPVVIARLGVGRTVAGNGSQDPSGDGGDAADAGLGSVSAIAHAADGSTYLADARNGLIRRIAPDGTISTVAGTGRRVTVNQISQPEYSDDGPATQTGIGSPQGIAVAPDGTVHFSAVYEDVEERTNIHLVRAIADGRVVTVAGMEAPRAERGSGDGGPAAAAVLYRPSGLAITSDGTVLVATEPEVRAVTTTGLVFTVAGGGTQEPAEGMSATNARFDFDFRLDSTLHDIAVDAEDRLVIATTSRIWRVRDDGALHLVAGDGEEGYDRDGSNARTARIDARGGIAVSPDGAIHFVQRGQDRARNGRHYVRTVGPDGVITTSAGGDNGAVVPAPFAVSRPPTELDLDITDLAIDGEGALSVANAPSPFDTESHIHRIAPALPAFEAATYRIATQDGLHVREFDRNGVHLRTVDTWTGETEWSFDHDDGGLLVAATDEHGRTIRVQRDPGGAPTAIISPDGRTTELSLDPGGMLATATRPDGLSDAFAYDGGLLISHTDRRQETSSYGYDDDGRLLEATDPSGARQTFARIGDDRDATVTRTDPDGVPTTYRRSFDPVDGLTDLVTEAHGASRRLQIAVDGDRVLTEADGTTTAVELEPDPRYGVQAPYPRRTTITVPTPGGGSVTKTETVDIDVETSSTGDPTDPASLERITVTSEGLPIGGQLRTATYDASARQLTRSHDNRFSTVATFDDAGRTVAFDFGDDYSALAIDYDDQGRVVTETRDGQVTRFSYDDASRVATIAFPDGKSRSYAYDEVGDVTAVTRSPEARLVVDHDAHGNPVSHTTPSGGTHTQSWSSRGELLRTALPVGTATTHSYAGQRSLRDSTTVGTGETLDYDRVDGQVIRLTHPGYTETYDWADQTLTASSWRPDTGTGQDLALDTAGGLVFDRTWTGAATGSYDYTYGQGHRLASRTFSGQDPIGYGFDRTGQVRVIGPFGVTRSDGSVLPQTITGPDSAIGYAFNSYGSQTQRTVTHDATTVADTATTRDGTDTVLGQTITIEGVATARTYTHDPLGRLLTVTDSAAQPVEAFGYDANGNVTAQQQGSGPVVTTTYNAADQVVAHGGVAYTYDEAGRLLARGSDTFDLTAEGDVVTATVDGTAVSYTYGAAGLRTSRTEGGQTTQLFHGDDDSDVLVTATIQPDGTVTEYLYDDFDHLFALRRGGAWYTVAVDAVGSPVAVIDAAGAVVKQIAYSAFGQILEETATDTFPLALGFAGGIHDRTTGLVRLGLRDYDPQTAHWTSADPARFDGLSANLYSYGAGDPVSHVDTSGGITAGASAYAGAGGGASVGIGPDGIAFFCVEMGYGVGAGVGLGDINETQAPPTDSWVTEAGLGPLSISKDVSPCGIGDTNVGFAPDLQFGGKTVYQKCYPL